MNQGRIRKAKPNLTKPLGAQKNPCGACKTSEYAVKAGRVHTNIRKGVRKMILSRIDQLDLESSSCCSFLRPAFSAVNRPAWVRLEWNFTFLSTFSANCLMHLFLSHFAISTPLNDFVQKLFLAHEPRTVCGRL